MRLMFKEELEPYVRKTKSEIVAFAKALIDSENASNWQKVGELSHLLRRNSQIESKDVAVEISRMMYEKSSKIDKLNQYFIAVADRADIAEIKQFDKMVTEYLEKNNLGYQKHLYATWLKAANTIQDNEMFNRVFNRIPSEEKVENTYIISQYYVYLNRHSMYADVRNHYATLAPNVQDAYFVKRYYENASERMGYPVKGGTNSFRLTAPTIVHTTINPEESVANNDTGEKKIFIVYGNNPDSLWVLTMLLDASKIPYTLLSEESIIGDTIIDNFERVANQTALALVLCTPEDEGKNGEWYPRQNVIYELGYFRAKLGANKACIVKQTGGKDMKMPSDLSGVMYIDMDNPAAFRPKLSEVLIGAGFNPTF